MSLLTAISQWRQLVAQAEERGRRSERRAIAFQLRCRAYEAESDNGGIHTHESETLRAVASYISPLPLGDTLGP